MDGCHFWRQMAKGKKMGRRVKCSLVHVKCEILVTRAGVTNDSWQRKQESLGKVLACRFRFVNYLYVDRVTATGSAGTEHS